MSTCPFSRSSITGVETLARTYRHAAYLYNRPPCRSQDRPTMAGYETIITPVGAVSSTTLAKCDSEYLRPMIGEGVPFIDTAPEIGYSLPLDYATQMHHTTDYLLAYAGDPIPYIDAAPESSFSMPAICSIPNRPLGQRTTGTIVQIQPQPTPEPLFVALITNELPPRSELKLGAFYLTKDTSNPDFLILTRVHSSTTRRTKRTMSSADIHTAVAAITFKDVVPYMATFAVMTAYLGRVNRNTFIMVADASGDPTVEFGGALYFFEKETRIVHKVSELSDVDGPLYSKVIGAPSSTPGLIDESVPKSHTHDNGLSTLDALSIVGNRMVYNRTPLEMVAKWQSVEW